MKGDSMHDETNPPPQPSSSHDDTPAAPRPDADPDQVITPSGADSDHSQPPLESYVAGLQFRDFVPQQLSNFGLFKVAEYETFEDAVLAANYWLIESPIELIQLETVVLPNIWSKYEEGTTDGSLGTSTGATSHWHQFLRVWFRPCLPEPADGE